LKQNTKFIAVANRIFDRVTHYSAVLSAVGIALVMFTLVIDVIFGRGFRIPLLGLYEFNAVLIGICIYLGLAYTQKKKQNITVTFISERLPKRVRTIINLLLLAISAILFGWATYLYYMAAYTAVVRHQVCEGIAAFPLFPLRLVMVLGVLMLTIQLVIDVGANLRSLISANTSK
jgi:TRAP-type C4-dicarboxylate transport system permease small subunit